MRRRSSTPRGKRFARTDFRGVWHFPSRPWASLAILPPSIRDGWGLFSPARHAARAILPATKRTGGHAMPTAARWAIAAVLFCAFTAPALAADYQTNLGPMPLDDETKAVIAGRGDATASYDGKTLTVKGNFHGLPSTATEAHLFLSEHIGVPGRQVLDLAVTKATSGTLSGSFALTAEQAEA